MLTTRRRAGGGMIHDCLEQCDELIARRHQSSAKYTPPRDKDAKMLRIADMWPSAFRKEESDRHGAENSDALCATLRAGRAAMGTGCRQILEAYLISRSAIDILVVTIEKFLC